jgi:hypothetical protein
MLGPKTKAGLTSDGGKTMSAGKPSMGSIPLAQVEVGMETGAVVNVVEV